MHLCGTVRHSPEESIVVVLESQTEKRAELVDEDGEYCFEVKPDRYRVYVEVKNGVSTFVPNQYDINMV